MALYALDGHKVVTPASGRFWVADNATLLGNVILDDDTTVWFNVVMRGDNVSCPATNRASLACVADACPVTVAE